MYRVTWCIYLQLSMDVLWILTIWFHWQCSLLQAANSGGKAHKHAWTRCTHCYKAYVYQHTLQWAVYDYFRILCNAFLVQNCRGIRHILEPQVSICVAVKLTQLFTQWKRLRMTLYLLTILTGTQKVTDKDENYCYRMLNSYQELVQPTSTEQMESVQMA